MRTMLSLLARLLVLALLIGLRFTGRELRLLLLWRRRGESRLGTEVGITLTLVAFVGLRVIALALWTRRLLRLALAELLLRCGDQTEVMFGVLVIVFRCDRITRCAGITRELHIFFGNVRGGAANLDIGPVRFENPRHRILTTAVITIVVITIVTVVVSTAHTLVVIRTVSHLVPSIDYRFWIVGIDTPVVARVRGAA